MQLKKLFQLFDRFDATKLCIHINMKSIICVNCQGMVILIEQITNYCKSCGMWTSQGGREIVRIFFVQFK